VRARDDEGSLRHVAAHVSSNLKIFADPTRLAILLWIGRHPASITEIAGHFQLSQPTVSAHVHQLREAGVLEERSSGRSAKLSVSEESLRRLLRDSEESLVKGFRR
jgi:DNA-binding transcriptional ArsR family regulator